MTRPVEYKEQERETRPVRASQISDLCRVLFVYKRNGKAYQEHMYKQLPDERYDRKSEFVRKCGERQNYKMHEQIDSYSVQDSANDCVLHENFKIAACKMINSCS